MILDRFKLNNKTALITGGTRGIGLAIAHAFGEAGAKLFIVSRTDNKKGIKSLIDAGYNAKLIEADLSDSTKPNEIVNLIINKKETIDILVNNAGVAQHGEIENFSDANLDKIMNTNVKGVFKMCRAVIPIMQKKGEGVILNIGSISGIVSNIPQPQAAYNASKAAIHMLTKSLASDFANQNIRVNAIAPGYVRTDMTDLPNENKHWYEIWNKMSPFNRMAEPEEISSAALFLCSPAASYISGEVLVIDGAYTAR